MAASFANVASTYASNQTTDTLAFPGTLTAGSTLCCVIAGWHNSEDYDTSTVSDGTQSWSQVPGTEIDDPTSSGDQQVEIWYFENNALTTAPTVTVTPVGASANYYRWGIVEIKGVETATVIRDEGTNSSSSSAAPTVSTTASDAVAGDAVVALFTNANGDTAINAAGGLTTEWWIYQDANDIAGEASYEVVGTGGTQTADWTMDTGSYAAAIAVFKATATTAGSVFPSKLLRPDYRTKLAR